MENRINVDLNLSDNDLELINDIPELAYMHTKNLVIQMYMQGRIKAELANYIYRNANENTELIMSDTKYDRLIEFLRKIEKDYPDVKVVFDTICDKALLKERV